MPRDYVLQPFRSPVDLQIDYARELNEQQYAAVTAPPGPVLVIAGAGAGKTRTLTYRVAYLLEQGVPADRLLLLTFTNKAAKEMLRRVADLLGGELGALWGGTFHAVGARLLRRHAEALGFRRDFTILDREDAKHLLSTCVAEADIDVKATRFPKAEVLADLFSLAVNRQQSILQTLAEQYDYFATLGPQIEDVHRRYQARKRATNVADFDDLLAGWLALLQDHADLRERYQRQFQFILVDEYQDTNQLQADLIDLLAARHHNVMVVGDDSQSIYSWRGANFQNILQFPRRHPEARTYKIEVNYRSTPEILTVANAAIAPNLHQFAKQLAPVRPSSLKPVLVTCADAAEQAAFVAQRVLELREEGSDMNRMAVLYRAHFHALELQLELTKRNIPFRITSGIRFFEQAHIKDVAAYLKLVCNPQDELAFNRLAQLLPGVGGKGADKLWKTLRNGGRGSRGGGREPEDGGQPAAAGAQAPEDRRRNLKSDTSNNKSQISNPQSTPLALALQSCADAVPKKAAAAWAQFTATISQLEVEPLCHQPAEMIELVLEAGYEDFLKANYANYRSRLEDLQQLAGFASQFRDTQEFLTQLSLLSNVEAEDNAPVSGDTEHLRLSTIHQAKGLEFDVVFIIMLCDGLFPSARALKRPEDEEEERRLFYVAITRARNELYLTYPLIRLTGGAGGDLLQRPSRFLHDIPKALLEEFNLRSFHPYG
ncbi:MAG: UvrD-helicase domain-containing protein [Verrucomicrobia bacterium]|nr:UvrD-helicase domain-containing protein [Verrucomicrobiota bacterium]